MEYRRNDGGAEKLFAETGGQPANGGDTQTARCLGPSSLCVRAPCCCSAVAAGGGCGGCLRLLPQPGPHNPTSADPPRRLTQIKIPDRAGALCPSRPRVCRRSSYARARSSLVEAGCVVAIQSSEDPPLTHRQPAPLPLLSACPHPAEPLIFRRFCRTHVALSPHLDGPPTASSSPSLPPLPVAAARARTSISSHHLPLVPARRLPLPGPLPYTASRPTGFRSDFHTHTLRGFTGPLPATDGPPRRSPPAPADRSAGLPRAPLSLRFRSRRPPSFRTPRPSSAGGLRPQEGAGRSQ